MQCFAEAPQPMAATCQDASPPPLTWPDPCAEQVAGMLVVIWALRSERIPLMPPYDQYSAEQLVDFWADETTATGHPLPAHRG
ncbi:hypothetical protein Misp01_78540 [Microtetraspora sp. NBRC 13810]|uniref:hypothetical protein n=1 Tax=Microtetraspora sp. NBRC 13810 TaxID=3030990 RepID=UPI0024A4A73A|nr:hypothetical protein [Microtetraspora sp. NBRC 13810]GLW12726.1 hypothetical protein Misp01_78540 [Microtetraspora sp. NBRC 13810]